MDCLYCHSRYVDNPVRPGRCGSCGAPKSSEQEVFDVSTINWEEYTILSTIDPYLYRIQKNKKDIAAITLTDEDIEAMMLSSEAPVKYVLEYMKKIIIHIERKSHENKPKLEAMAYKHRVIWRD